MARAGPRALTPLVLVWRAAHAAVAVGFLASIGYVWWCAISGRRDRWLGAAVGALAAEGAVVAANNGDCPLGPLGERIGDPVPLFELVLPARAAKLAVPALGIVAGAGIAAVAIRPGGRGRGAATAGPRAPRARG